MYFLSCKVVLFFPFFHPAIVDGQRIVDSPVNIRNRISKNILNLFY